MQQRMAPNIRKSWNIITESMEWGVWKHFGESTNRYHQELEVWEKPQWLENYRPKEVWLACRVSNLIRYCVPINSYVMYSICIMYQERRRTTVSRRITTALWMIVTSEHLKLQMGAISNAWHTPDRLHNLS